MNEEVLLFSEQRDWFLEMEPTLGGDAINIINIAYEYYINLVVGVVEFKRIKSILKEVLLILWIKYYKTCTA